MAWGIKYRIYFDDQTGVRDNTIEILEENYASTITELKAAETPFELNYNNDPHILGSEAIIKFVTDQATVGTLDTDFLESAYKSKKVYFKTEYGGNPFILWNGWLKPENTSREYHPGKIVYQLSATDALNDLKGIDYLDSSGNQYTDKTSGLTIIKRALSLNGIDDNKIVVQCNILENSMSANETPFEEIQFDNRRFYKETSGEIKPMSAYEVIVSILKIFYCRLYQHGMLAETYGAWMIRNEQEVSSYRIIYNWDLTISSQGASNRELDINSHKPYNSKWTLSKEPPVKDLRVIFRNRNLGENEITNGDFSSGTTGWANSGTYPWTSFSVSGGVLVTAKTTTVTDTFLEYDRTTTFGIASYESGDTIQIKLRVYIDSITWAVGGGSYYPSIYATLNYPTLGSTTSAGYVHSTEGQWITIVLGFPITETGNYDFTIGIQVYGSLDSVTYWWDDFEINHIRQTQPTDITTDKLYKFASNSTGYEKEEIEVLFGDSIQTSDIGALVHLDSGTLTSTWKRYGKTETLSILYILALQNLNDKGAYRTRFLVDIYDPNDEINMQVCLLYDSKYYIFENYSKDFKLNKVSGTIIETHNITGSDFTLTEVNQNLTTIDGKETGESTIIQTGGTSLWSNSTYGIYRLSKVGVGMVPTSMNAYFQVTGNSYFNGKLIVGSTVIPSGNVGKAIIVGATQAPTDYGSLFELSLGTGIYTDEKLAFGINGTGARWIQGVKAGTGFRALSLNPGGGAVNINGGGSIVTALTASRAMVTGASSELAVSATTATELGYVNGVTSAIQTQLNGKQATITGLTASGAELNILDGATLSTEELNILDGATLSVTELNLLDGAASSTYTPTLTGVTNISSSTSQRAQYIRIGNTVIVFGTIQITSTSSGSTSTIDISFPIASAITLGTHCNGVANSQATDAKGRITGNATDDRASLTFVAKSTGNDPMSYTFAYEIV